MSNNCSTGKVSILECPPIGNDCVGIKSIVFNTDNTMTVTLTDGTTYTSGSLKGAKGAKGDAGATGATGVVLLYNEYSNATTALTGSYQTLDSFALAAAQLGADGDMIHIHAVFNVLVLPTNPDYNLVRIRLGGNDLIEVQMGENFGANATIDIWLSRTDTTDSKYEYQLIATDGVNWLSQKNLPPSAFASTTWANAQTISAQVNQVAATSIQLKVLQVTYIAQS